MGLDEWKAKARFDVTLPSGTVVTLRLPAVQDFFVAAAIPIQVAKARADGEESAPPSLEALEQEARFERTVVRLTVVAVDGEDVTLSDEDIDALPVADKAEIVAYATRSKPSPKATG